LHSSSLPSWCRFLVADFPSANRILLTGRHPVLVDTGYGSDFELLVQELASAGLRPEALSVVVNTHWHSDHVGGNYRLQHRHGVPIAAAREDAVAVNARDPQACLAVWLDQPIEPYHVDRPINSGDRISAGEAEWQVIATPGHTPSHLSFFQPDERLLIVGDALHADDIGWINLPLEGSSAIDQALRSVEALAALPARLALSGHGPLITDPPATLARAHERYTKLRNDPVPAGWHALKRIFAYALMLYDGIPVAEVDSYLARRAWLADYAANVFRMDASQLSRDLLTEMRRSGAVVERDGRLYSTTPHHRPAAGWRHAPGFPAQWPA